MQGQTVQEDQGIVVIPQEIVLNQEISETPETQETPETLENPQAQDMIEIPELPKIK